MSYFNKNNSSKDNNNDDDYKVSKIAENYVKENNFTTDFM